MAAIGVAAAHYFAFSGSATSEFLATLFVEMFFPLSGFILAPQILKVYREPHQFKIFMCRRWVRTIPLYFVGLLAAAMVTKSTGVWDIGKYAIFVNFLSPGYSENNFYAVSWSLAIEEYFYVLFPLLLIWVKGSPEKKVYALIIGSLAVKLGLALAGDAQFIRIATYSRLDAIAIGFYFHLLIVGGRMASVRRLFPLAILAAVAASLAHFYLHSAVTVIFFVYALNLFFGSVCSLIYDREKQRPATLRGLRPVADVLGKTSYGVYVFHSVLLMLAINFKTGFAVYIAGSIGLALVIYKYFEKPLLDARPSYRELPGAMAAAVK